MRKTILMVLILCLIPATAMALDGEVYFGFLMDSTLRAYPDGGRARYVSGVELGQRIDIFRPYLKLETLMDSYNGDGSFHPASIRYDIGISADIYRGLYIKGSRMCWHPVDRAGSTEEYWQIRIGYKF